MHEIVVADVKKYLEETDRKFQFVFADLPYEVDIIGNEWDRSGIAFDTEMYRLLLAHMTPGSFGCFYGFSRTHHRVMVALEDAGWIIHKTIFAWLYPDGNPQGAQNTSKRLDKVFASQYGGFCECDEPKRFVANDGYINAVFQTSALATDFCVDCLKPIKKVTAKIQHSKTGGMKKIGGPGYGNGNVQEITEPMCIESLVMQNRVYSLGWGKPILEPLIVVQAPYGNESEIHNIVRYGTGTVDKSGIHPGNFIFMHDPDCTKLQCTENCISRTLKYKYNGFYYNLSEDLDAMVYSHVRAKKERHEGLSYDNPHPSVKPLAVDEWIGRIFLPPDLWGKRVALNLFSGSGSEIIGLRRAGWDSIVGVEKEIEYAHTAHDRFAYYFPGENLCIKTLRECGSED